MQRLGLREQSTITLLLAFDVLWGAVAYLLAFIVRIHVPLPFTTIWWAPVMRKAL
jgi:hypothetical protein